MNYRHVYCRIISNAKQLQEERLQQKNAGVYFECHHILPASLFPKWKTKKDNLVLLTAREHYFCHVLLAKIYGVKMWFAMNMIQNASRYKKILSSRDYERMRLELKTYFQSKNFRDKIRIQQKEVWSNPELLKKHSEILKEVMNRPEIAEKRNKGVRAANCQKVKNKETGLAFNSLNEASIWACGHTGLSSKIGECCRGGRKHAGKVKNTMQPASWEYIGLSPRSKKSGKFDKFVNNVLD